VKEHAAKFPILKCLVQNCRVQTKDSGLSVDMSLNSVWRRVGELALLLTPHFREIVNRYAQEPKESRIRNVVRRLLLAFGPTRFIGIMLGIELKRMVALQYEELKLHAKRLEDLPGLKAIIEDGSASMTTWVSLNYDTALEVLLQGPTGTRNWQYSFEGSFTGNAGAPRARHVLAKPHGSLNVWFDSVWRSPPWHRVYFADANNYLATCAEGQVGCDYFRKGEAPREYRPWLIGYLPDEMKEEINSPGYYADAAHDLCKANVAFAALSLQKASSLYVLGYSMPPEDTWVWSRVVGVCDKSLPVYVASASNTESIANRFREHGFTVVEKLTESGNL